MPRQNGTFQRFNSEFYGAQVWQDDLEISEKIIALRHDVHDEDLAQGIAQCLPKDGSEPMLGSLNAGGFTIANLSNGIQEDEAVNFSQTITAVDFNETNRLLTLHRAGMDNLAVTILGGGDNTIINYGVQALTVSTGLEYASGDDTADEANPVQTIRLKNTGVSAGTFANANVTVNAQGQITSITTGSPDVIDLGSTQSSTAVIVTTNTGGTNADILGAIATGQPNARAGVMTAAQAKQLEDAVAGSGTELSIQSRTNETLNVRSSTAVGQDATIPFATQSLAGLMTAADKTALDNLIGTSGDPDQSISIDQATSPNPSQVPVNLSQTGTFDQVAFMEPATTSYAGCLASSQLRRFSGLAVDGNGDTQRITTNARLVNSYQINDHTGQVYPFSMWEQDACGMFSGELRTTVPDAGEIAAAPAGYFWMIYDA